MEYQTFPDLIGHTFTDVYKADRYDGDSLVFLREDQRVFRFYHAQDCCESVTIEDICGDLSDLTGSPIRIAEECTGQPGDKSEEYESGTWTFYKFSTIRGFVTVRWYGCSNGYYSESVDFEECENTADWIR